MATISLICQNCGNPFTVPFKLRKQRFCGHSCVVKFYKPGSFITEDSIKRNADARRGRGNGYVKRDGRHEHRSVMERKLGRLLLPGEIVHHVDEIKGNNDPDNLELTNRVDHARLHNSGKKRTPKLTCKFGHPLSGDNVRERDRRCLTCHRAYDSMWHRQKRRAERGDH